VRQSLWGAALLAVGIATGFGVATFRAAPKPPAPAAEASDRAPSLAVEPSAKPTPSGEAFRARLLEAMAKAQNISVEDGERFLDGLEARARMRGSVTALEVEPGIVYLQNHGTPERAKAFSDRMLKLQRELAGTAAPAPDPSFSVSAAREMLTRIEQSAGEGRQELIRGLLEKLPGLPEDAQLELSGELNRIARSDPAKL